MCNARQRIKIRKSAQTEIFLPGGNGTGRELKEIIVGRVDLVRRGANQRTFAIMKSEGSFYECESCGERYPKAEIIKLLKTMSAAVKCACGLPVKLQKSDTAVTDAETEAAEKAKVKAEADAKAKADAKAAADAATVAAAAKGNDNKPDASAVIELARQERDLYKDKADRLEAEVTALKDKVAALEADNAELETIANENIDQASAELGITSDDDEEARKKAEAEEEAKRKAAEEAAKE